MCVEGVRGERVWSVCVCERCVWRMCVESVCGECERKVFMESAREEGEGIGCAEGVRVWRVCGGCSCGGFVGRAR